MSRAAGALDQAVEQLEAARTEALENLSGEAVTLAVEIAQHLLRAEIQAGNYDMERIVRDTLATADVGRQSCVVHLNPEDCERLADISFRSSTVLEGDPEVPQGDVHISTQLGLIVRDLDDTLRAIGERLREGLR